MTVWPDAWRFAWSPHPEERDRIPPTEVVVFAETVQRARAVAFFVTALTLRNHA